MKIVMRSPNSLIPYERNARENAAAINEVVKSIREFGVQQPIVVDKDDVIIVGHTRREAAIVLGLDRVPVKVADELTEAQIKAYRLMDNRTSDFATWKEELVISEIEEIAKLSENLTPDFMGFNISSLLDLDAIENFKFETGDDKMVTEILIQCMPNEREQVIEAINALPFKVTFEVQSVRQKV